MKLSDYLLLHPEKDFEIGSPLSASTEPPTPVPAADFDSAEAYILRGRTVQGYVNHSPEEMEVLLPEAKAAAAAHPDVDPRVYVVGYILGWPYVNDLAGWTPEQLWTEKLSPTGLGPSGGPA